MTSVYTDMGSRNNITAIAYVIVDDHSHICSDSMVIECEANKSTDSKELMAVYYALLKVQEIGCQPPIEVITDSTNTIAKIHNKKERKSLILKRIRSIAKDYKIRFKHIQGHLDRRNLNVLVDNMCTAKIKEALMNDTS